MKLINFKTKLFFAIIFIALGVSSCKKFLDQQPITQVGPNFVFVDVPTTLEALAGVYNRLTGDAGYGIRLSLYYTLDNDEEMGPKSGIGGRYEIDNYATTSNNTEIINPWTQLFQGIDYANICIDQIPQMAMYKNGTLQQKKQLQRMLGEVLTLRSQFYFEAIRNWGDLPADFQPAYTLAQANPFPFRVNRDTLYVHILNDLLTAENLMPWRNDLASIGDRIDERLTKGTAKALRAKIALFMGGYSLRQSSKIMERRSDYLTYYQIARDECNDIILSNQHSLNPSYKSLWKDQVGSHAIADPDGELMFQVTGIGKKSIADTKLGYYNGPKMGTTGNASVLILPTYFYLFDSLDLRRDVVCAPYTVNADGVTKTGNTHIAMNDGKYRRDWLTPALAASDYTINYSGLKWQILRYSDVLLMFAESENELNGPTTAAYEAVNKVVRRGHGKQITTPDATVDIPSGLSKTDFFTMLTQERSKELGGEGIRKYDLIRWNLLKTNLDQTRNWLSAMVGTAPTLPVGVGPYGGLITLPKAMYYKNGTIADDKTIWANSFYAASPTSTPAGTSKKNWFDANSSNSWDIKDKMADFFAKNFMLNKSELFPIPQSSLGANINLTQNPNY